MVDRVQAHKWESSGHGGTDDDPLPSEIEPNSDGLDARASFYQSDSSSDSDVYVSRDALGNMVFKDKIVPSLKTLTELLATGGDSNIDGGRADTVYTVQDIDGGNAASF